MSARIQKADPRWEMGTASKLLAVLEEIPLTDAAQEAARDLETAVTEYGRAMAGVKTVDTAEADHARKIRAEANAAVSGDRDPKAIKAPDFADARQKATAIAEATLAKATAARAHLDRTIVAERGAWAAMLADNMAQTYASAAEALTAAQEALATLVRAHDLATDAARQSDPSRGVKFVPETGQLAALEKVATWLADHKSQLSAVLREELLTPPLEERYALAARHSGRLRDIERSENWSKTAFSLEWSPANDRRDDTYVSTARGPAQPGLGGGTSAEAEQYIDLF
ncbi:hypothetical protein [Occultella kanbiaonis]|uniref:hypothetical protein n=1 Tax=Occultella kanbiaonis TaxID=2675754 RepID=UPI0012B79418|nr:hypothetical protein [Occultella kanbiaonis]